MIIRGIVLLTFLVLLCANFAVVQCAITEGHLDLSAFDHSDYHGFEHHTHLFKSVADGKKSFSVRELNAEIKPVNLAATSAASSATSQVAEDAYDTHSDYTLHENQAYHILDHGLMAGDVREVSDRHMLFCSSTASSSAPIASLRDAKTGDYVLGTQSGAWASADSAAHWLRTTQHVSAAAKADIDLLAVSRRVLRSTPVGAECVNLETETINPLLIFPKWRVETVFHKDNFQRPETRRATRDKKRKLLGMTYGDGGPMPCNNAIWQGSGGWTWDYSAGNAANAGNDDYTIDLNLGESCAQFTKTYSVFNFNGNSNNPPDGPASVLTLGNGMQCTNCWGYLGATMFVLAEFSTGANGIFVRADVKASGAAAAELDFTATNPTWSGASNGVFLAPATDYASFPINAYMTINFKMGGVNYAVSGTGSATGNATVVGGFSASMSVEATYDETNGFLTQYSKQLSTTPVSAQADFTAASFNAQVTLTSTENSFLSIGYSTFALSLAVDLYVNEILQLVTTIQAGSSVSAAAQVSVSHVAPVAQPLQSLTPEVLSSPVVESKAFVPGSIVRLTYKYTDHTPNERVTLFASIVPESGVESSILQQDFHTDASGSGSFEVLWTVPWDERFAGTSVSNTHFVMRTSQDVESTFVSEAITLNMFTGTDGGVVSPEANAALSLNEPVLVQWEASSMVHFQMAYAGIRHQGAVQRVEHVNVDFVGEILDAVGNVLSTTSFRAVSGDLVANTGFARVSVPPAIQQNAASLGHRWWVVVSGAAHPHVKTWSRQTFTFAAPKDQYGYPAVSPVHMSVAAAQMHPATKHLAALDRQAPQTVYRFTLDPATGKSVTRGSAAQDAESDRLQLVQTAQLEAQKGRRALQGGFPVTLTATASIGVQVTSITAVGMSMPVMSAAVFYPIFTTSGTSTLAMPSPGQHLPVDPNTLIEVVGTIPPRGLGPVIPKAALAEPPVSPPAGPKLEGWYISGLYNNPQCSGAPLYNYAQACGRCEMQDNQHYSISTFFTNSTTGMSSLEVFYYTDKTCTTLRQTNPMSWKSLSLGVLGVCQTSADGLHYLKHSWDETYDTAPVFASTGPSTVSYDSDQDCGSINKVQSFTVYAPTCYTENVSTGVASHHTNCANPSSMAADPSSATSVYMQHYSDTTCAIASTHTVTPFRLCVDAAPSVAQLSGAVIYNFGMFKTDYCGNSLVTGSALPPPPVPVPVPVTTASVDYPAAPMSNGVSAVLGAGAAIMIMGFGLFFNAKRKSALMVKTVAADDIIPAATTTAGVAATKSSVKTWLPTTAQGATLNPINDGDEL